MFMKTSSQNNELGAGIIKKYVRWEGFIKNTGTYYGITGDNNLIFLYQYIYMEIMIL